MDNLQQEFIISLQNSKFNKSHFEQAKLILKSIHKAIQKIDQIHPECHQQKQQNPPLNNYLQFCQQKHKEFELSKLQLRKGLFYKDKLANYEQILFHLGQAKP